MIACGIYGKNLFLVFNFTQLIIYLGLSYSITSSDFQQTDTSIITGQPGNMNKFFTDIVNYYSRMDDIVWEHVDGQTGLQLYLYCLAGMKGDFKIVK